MRSGDVQRRARWLQLPLVKAPGDWDDETLGDALDVLQDLVLWELVPQRWEQVEKILARIGTAMASHDVDDLRDAVADLELSGPVRLSMIGTIPVRGIPEPVFDRRNTLVYELILKRERRSAATTETGSGDRPTR